jgi:hypothetical protein
LSAVDSEKQILDKDILIVGSIILRDGYSLHIELKIFCVIIGDGLVLIDVLEEN